MGTTSSKPESVNGKNSIKSSSQPEAPPVGCPVGLNSNKSSSANPQVSSKGAGGCPVKHSPEQVSTAPREEPTESTTIKTRGEEMSRCPVKQGGRAAMYLNPHKYDVYGRRVEDCGTDSSGESIDSSNQMPSNPNQQPTPGQRRPLSTERVQSTIPKGGADTTWTYPSPQMFWNALARKGKIEDTGEEDMDIVVAIHNNMNENTWKEILKWEQIRSDAPVAVEGAEPRLLRFMGRPNDTSPKAIAKMMFGHPLPFDRHDWVVDRGGVERRYVIDYYHDEGMSAKDEKPELQSEGAVRSIKVDVRPALDDPYSVFDRLLTMPFYRFTGKSDFVPLPFLPPLSMRNQPIGHEPRNISVQPRSIESGDQETQGQESSGTSVIGPAGVGLPGLASSQDFAELQRVMARIKEECAGRLETLREAEEDAGRNPAKAQAAAIGLEHCTACIVCPPEATAYGKAVGWLKVHSDEEFDTYFAEVSADRKLMRMRACLDAFTERQFEAARRRARDEGI